MTTSPSTHRADDLFDVADLPVRGFAVLRDRVPRDAVEGALRHIHLDLIQRGVDADTLGKWLWSSHWFPHLKWDAPIASLAAFLPDEVRDGEQCDPQIVVQPPDDCDDVALTSHIDELPAWAEGRPYRSIAGVALSPSRRSNGGLWVWPFGQSEATPIDLDPGDVLLMHPQLPHASGLNREGGLRYAVYFRFLERS